MNVFIATAMSGLSRKDYNDLKASIRDLANTCEDNVFAEILNVEHDKFQTPKDATIKDIKEIEKSDLFILFHVSNVLSSSLFELGIAYALNKQILIIYHDQYDLPFMMECFIMYSFYLKTLGEL